MLTSPDKNGTIKNVPEDDMVIDTSQMNEGKRKALEIAESSRDSYSTSESFASSLFMGEFPANLIRPFPEQSESVQL